MTTDTMPSTSEDVRVLEMLRGHYERAVDANGNLAAVGHLRAFALIEVPTLLEIATRGVQARQQLDPLAGISIRAVIVRGLHSADDRGAGLVVCEHCSSFRHRPILWPCPTLQALDDLQAP